MAVGHAHCGLTLLNGPCVSVRRGQRVPDDACDADYADPLNNSPPYDIRAHAFRAYGPISVVSQSLPPFAWRDFDIENVLFATSHSTPVRNDPIELSRTAVPPGSTARNDGFEPSYRTTRSGPDTGRY